MINWQYFPKSDETPSHLHKVVEVFHNEAKEIDSFHHQLSYNEVLEKLREGLEGLEYVVEKSKSQKDKIRVPVLFGRNGNLEKYF